jgi:hypothetical protein
MNIFTENTYKRLNIVNKINLKYSDSLLKYLTSLPTIEVIKPNYITLSEKPPLGALIESRFARYDSILNSVKLLHKKYVLDLKPHKIIIYGNDVSTTYINHVASIIRWWEKIKPQTYYITFYLTNIKKRLPPNNLPKVLTEEYMNSGFTFVKEPCDIHIFRKEESLKVLIHELIHASKFDCNHLNLNNTPVVIRDEDLANEGITEYLAIIHYYWYVANYISKTPTEQFSDLLAYDLGWQAYQISKILHYFELKPSDLLTKNNNFKQKTSVISYFFLKNYLFSQDSLPIILSRDIKKINALIDNMKQFLIDYKMEPIFQNSLSMRMSLYELEY